jgi:hypothetical protein
MQANRKRDGAHTGLGNLQTETVSIPAFQTVSKIWPR